MMPHFFVIGASRSGTTSLYHYLRQHPQIYLNPLKKEARFFGFWGEPLGFGGPGDDAAAATITHSLAEYEALFRGASAEQRIGDISPIYLYLPKAAEQIHRQAPQARLVAVLRHPVERAYSSFLNLRRKRLEPLEGFDQAMLAEPGRIAAGWHPRWHHKERGFYARQLHRFLEQFTAGQLRVYLSEELRNRPIEVLRDLFQFLGVDPSVPIDCSQQYHVQRQSRFAGLRAACWLGRGSQVAETTADRWPSQHWLSRLLQLKSQLPATVRHRWLHDYAADIRRLEPFIGRDLSHWLN